MKKKTEEAKAWRCLECGDIHETEEEAEDCCGW